MSKERDEVRDMIAEAIIECLPIPYLILQGQTSDEEAREELGATVETILDIPSVAVLAEDQSGPELLSLILCRMGGKPDPISAYLHEHGWQKVVKE